MLSWFVSVLFGQFSCLLGNRKQFRKSSDLFLLIYVCVGELCVLQKHPEEWEGRYSICLFLLIIIMLKDFLNL